MREFINIVTEATSPINAKIAAAAKKFGFDARSGYETSDGYIDSPRATRFYYLTQANKWYDHNHKTDEYGGNFANVIYHSKNVYDKIRNKLPDKIRAYYDWHHSTMGQIATLDEPRQMAMVKKQPLKIQYIENPSEAVQLAAVQSSGEAIEYINNPSEAVQLAAIEDIDHAFEYIKNPSEAVQLAAVQKSGYLIYYIPNPSEAVQLAAINQYPGHIDLIDNSVITSKVKGQILKHVISHVKDEDTGLFKMLQNKNLNWPELKTIELSLKQRGLI